MFQPTCKDSSTLGIRLWVRSSLAYGLVWASVSNCFGDVRHLRVVTVLTEVTVDPEELIAISHDITARDVGTPTERYRWIKQRKG